MARLCTSTLGWRRRPVLSRLARSAPSLVMLGVLATGTVAGAVGKLAEAFAPRAVSQAEQDADRRRA